MRISDWSSDVCSSDLPVLVHGGFTAPKALAAELEDNMPGLTNVFVEDHAKLLYRKHFDQSTRILVRDGFKRQRNADYPAMEEFSDLHVTYGDHGMAGFRSEEHTSELQSLMRISYAVFCLKKKIQNQDQTNTK